MIFLTSQAEFCEYFFHEKSHPFDILSVRKKNRMLSYESKFSRHMRSMDNAAEHFMFFKWKSKFWVQNKITILFTNHFDLGWKENSLIKIDWDPVELSRKTVMISTKPRRPPPGGVTCVNFCWVCAAGLSEPLPHYSLFCGQYCGPHISHSWGNM